MILWMTCCWFLTLVQTTDPVILHNNRLFFNLGLAGLALSYALSVTSRLSGVITAFTETEKQMVAVERESHYINNIPQERETIDIDPKIIGPWPRVGDIHFSNVSLRYREELPLAVCDVSLIIGRSLGFCYMNECIFSLCLQEVGRRLA